MRPACSAMCLALIAAAGLAALATGCSKDRGDSIEARRVAKSASPDAASSAERFGMEGPAQAGAAAQARSLTYSTPAGWKEIAPAQFRKPNFVIEGPDGAQGECYVTMLPGGGGGELANINRWRGQFGLAPIDEAQMKELPRIDCLGRPAPLVDVSGTFSGMMAGSAPAGGQDAAAPQGKTGYRLLGSSVIQDGIGVFVKLTGPAELVAGQIDAFKQFCASLRLADAPVAGDPHAGIPGAPAIGADPHAGLNMGAGAAVGGFVGAQLAWKTPEGWQDAGATSMRLANFRIGPDQAAEVYVALLSGAAGGVEPNINRWRGQMGLAPLTPAEIAALPKIQVLGQDAPVVEMEGNYTGMSGTTQPDAALLGAVVMLGERTLFIKMTGPRETVRAEKERFIEFSRSLTIADSEPRPSAANGATTAPQSATGNPATSPATPDATPRAEVGS